eukprot:2467107-Rhodomonas_salina.2
MGGKAGYLNRNGRCARVSYLTAFGRFGRLGSGVRDSLRVDGGCGRCGWRALVGAALRNQTQGIAFPVQNVPRLWGLGG